MGGGKKPRPTIREIEKKVCMNQTLRGEDFFCQRIVRGGGGAFSYGILCTP